MGNHLSLTTPTASTVAIDAYISELQTVQYDRNLGNSRFLKTVKGISEMSLAVVKVFIKPDGRIDLRRWYDELVQQRAILSDVENALPYARFLETDRAGYLVRQFIKTNLYDRIRYVQFHHIFTRKISNCTNLALGRFSSQLRKYG